MKNLPTRAEIPAEYKWNTDRLYADESIWQADLAEIKRLIPQAAGFQGRLGEGADTLLAFLQFQERLSRLIDRVYLYAAMKKDEDNTVPRYQGMRDQILAAAVEAEGALSFYEPEMLALPSQTLQQYQADPKLALYRKHFADMLRFRPHTLSAAEERLLSMSGEMAASFDTIYTMLCNADMRFPMIENAEGEQEQLSHGNYIRFLESTNRQVRHAAFDAYYDTYGAQINTLAAVYAASVKKDVFYARAKQYADSRAASLFADNVPTAVYDNLIAAVRKHLPLFWDYLRFRRQTLGLPELQMYDVYVPLFPEGESKYTYEQAKELVLAAMAPLGAEYGRILAHGLADGWVDVYENVGKTPGAYSSGIYDSDPYILMNFQGNLNSVFTLAHELGHSLHSYFSCREQPYIYSSYRIFVAEVASTVNETLLTDYMLKQAKSDAERIAILNYYLEQFRGTVFRQTMFAEFELRSHQTVEAGGILTAESLNDLYYGLNKDYFGQEIDADPKIAMEWSRIPHFYRAFYVYKYATGFSAAQALALGMLDADPAKAAAAQQRYLQFLAAGDSLEPIEALRLAGVDMASPQPVEAAMQIFRQRLGELQELLGRKSAKGGE